MAACIGCQVVLRVPNRPEFVAVARLTVAAVATRLAFGVDAIEDIKVAVAEACTNALEHGCPECEGQQMITLTCDVTAQGLVIVIDDPGAGFDPLTATRQRHGTLTLTERGLGMLLIESLMDEVAFESTPGDGTRVRMVKYLRAMEGEEH